VKKLGVVIAIVAASIVGFLLLTKPASAPKEKVVTEQAARLSFATIKTEAEKGSVLLLDVRTPEEYAAGYFAPAKNVPVQDIQAGTMPSSDKTQAVYVYCRSGNRSHTAAQLLRDAGFTNVTDLGGLDAVKAMGGTLTKEGGTL